MSLFVFEAIPRFLKSSSAHSVVRALVRIANNNHRLMSVVIHETRLKSRKRSLTVTFMTAEEDAVVGPVRSVLNSRILT